MGRVDARDCVCLISLPDVMTTQAHLYRQDDALKVPAKPVNQAWLADQFRKQEERRCYVCGSRDDGCCRGIDGEMAECPWY